jgi:hypothetical protein
MTESQVLLSHAIWFEIVWTTGIKVCSLLLARTIHDRARRTAVQLKLMISTRLCIHG